MLLWVSSCSVGKYSELSVEQTTLINAKGKERKAKRITISTVLPQSADSIWSDYQDSRFVNNISQPYGKLKPRKQYQVPKRWVEQQTDSFKLIIHGFIPFGSHNVYWESIDSAALSMQTRERGGFVHVWDNSIVLSPLSDSTTRYTDTLVVEAGVLTGFTTLWAKGFYRFRHRSLLMLCGEGSEGVKE